LVDTGGAATLRQLAQVFVQEDESQLLYYQERIKAMPVRVLKKHGVVNQSGELITLNVPKLSLEQKAQIKVLCEKKLQEYVQRRGIGIWDYRMLDMSPVPDSLYYEVMTLSDGRCQLCGASKKDRPLQVDHIVPRSRGGRTVRENLQVLCDKCNRAKSNRDNTDFRKTRHESSFPGCPFCAENVEPRVVETVGTVVAIEDKYPVTTGHLLIIPRRHTPDYFAMNWTEKEDTDALLRILRQRAIDVDSSITGFNVGINCGLSAGQTVFHAHIHLIPRRDGDTFKPSGGVRGVIPERMSY
jgi:ATP adenylyltransferase